MAIFHIAPRGDWEAQQDGEAYRPPSLEVEGFIHFSTGRQLLGSAERYFVGREDLLVVSVRQGELHAPLRWEKSERGELFPHLYGPLNLDAVVEVVALPRQADGRFDVPEPWRPWAHLFERGSTS